MLESPCPSFPRRSSGTPIFSASHNMGVPVSRLSPCKSYSCLCETSSVSITRPQRLCRMFPPRLR
ncbi:hypothetical protein K402DRAFT_60435 [Aulographum hederae CBS 113979]|uniref:Uncharacterized protein n=1 Tax=Aulographum hederae CBS 113979 TaxID=1176131 RepID=A0A6G1H1S6_9PEZI|nr:hypothetical protein K402DRAFT_60435 [Aulographum hederae CBS 113979]